MSKQNEILSAVGCVVIGRNEGDRLKRCIESLRPSPTKIVYVDSGSADGSVNWALSQGMEVLELDMSAPFSAARARNAGYQRLVEAHPQLRYIQFIDADCEINGDWLPFAAGFLTDHPKLAVVAGWLHERHPESSIYNRLGDLEWNFSGAGEVDSVGGIFMIRREAFDSVGGFDATVSAGEEPELCQRLRQRGWLIARVDRDMALHDLAMTRFWQWWRRTVRSGYGSLEVANRFGVAKFARNNWRVRFWTAWLLLLIAGCIAAVVVENAGVAMVGVLALLAVWPAQLLRITVRTLRNGQPPGIAFAYAFFIMISFLPQMWGQILYWADGLQRRPQRLVEYKSAGTADNDRNS